MIIHSGETNALDLATLVVRHCIYCKNEDWILHGMMSVTIETLCIDGFSFAIESNSIC